MTTIRQTNKSITKKLNRIENSLKSKLNSFYNKKVKPMAQFPIEAIRQKYEREVKTLIRVTVQQAYLVGTDTVAEKVTDKNKDFEVFISQTDIQNIARLTDKVNEQFWKTTGRLVRREQESILVDGQLEKKKSFDTTAAMIGFSAFATFSAFNNAVVSKTQAVTNLSPIALSADGFSLDINFDVTRLDELNLQGKVMFLTQEDAKVDLEICEPLNRTVYDINDPDIPNPPLHNHCRCRLIPIVDESSI